MAGKATELTELADLLEARATSGQRVIAALAGAPGSGKSTLADKLVGKLNGRQPGLAAVLPMDGYHYDDLYLVPAGLRPRKGAPMTFDVGGLYHTLQRMRARDEAEVAVPVFDRKIEIARAGARLIPREV
ncbi:MAG: nucleoside/nucleotide kinase family protein, partial [Tabrizicola sp.]|nr:nucleoside/nucleotide kinase family protein [Tabrizicola sp.]